MIVFGYLYFYRTINKTNESIKHTKQVIREDNNIDSKERVKSLDEFLSDEEIDDRFGWFIEALSYGTPVHAGFAIGIDRLVAVVLNQPSIRDVIPV